MPCHEKLQAAEGRLAACRGSRARKQTNGAPPENQSKNASAKAQSQEGGNYKRLASQDFWSIYEAGGGSRRKDR